MVRWFLTRAPSIDAAPPRALGANYSKNLAMTHWNNVKTRVAPSYYDRVV